MIPGVAGATGTNNFPYRWVTVGGAGYLYTSDETNAANWTSRTSGFGSTQINCVASNCTSLYVAVGNSGVLCTSPDAITWTARTSSFSTTNIFTVAYGNGVWVAAGASGKLATSTDGTTWTQRTTGFLGTDNIRRVAYGGGIWVAGGTAGKIFTATDPTSTWTSRTSTMTSEVYGINYDTVSSIWVIGTDAGTTGALASSTNGTTWTSRDAASTMVAGQFSIASSPNVQVIGNNNNPQTSTNGTTWTAIAAFISGNLASDLAGNFVSTYGQSVPSNQLYTYTSSGNATTWSSAAVISAPSSTNSWVCHSSGLPGAR